MPVSRRRPRGRTIKTLDSFGLDEILCFLACWSPREPPFDRGNGRWKSYADFMTDYVAIRAELLADPDFSRGPIFAEWIYQRYGTKVPAEMAELVPSEYPAQLPEPRLVLEYWNDMRKDDR